MSVAYYENLLFLGQNACWVMLNKLNDEVNVTQVMFVIMVKSIIILGDVCQKPGPDSRFQ